MSSAGLEPTISAIEWPQTYALDRSARLPTSKEKRGEERSAFI
jgi:hypothetical protein